jgi:cystathionine beta-lyase/cystathionine gamma-synthase
MNEAVSSLASEWSFRTAAVHAGEREPWPDCATLSTPIFSTSAFISPDMQTSDEIFGSERPGFVYTRYGNPTVAALERAVATLERGEAALAYASGMAAIYGALLSAGLQGGDRIVASRDLYGATFALLSAVLPKQGIETTFVDACDLAELEEAVKTKQPRLVLVETISNPLMRVADLEAIAAIARQCGAVSIVDSSFASPFLVQPITLGVDIVVHSMTKYLGGHGDVTGGVMVASRDTVQRGIELTKLVGGILGPFEAWLTLRGVKTLPLRVERQCQNALRLAEWMAAQPMIAKVNYPGLPAHPQHRLASRMLRQGYFGGMISFEIANGSKLPVMRFMDGLRLCLAATTLGDVYTELLYPAISSHRALGPEQRAAFGINDSLVRISVGIEDIQDIQDDIDQALRACGI